MTRSLVFLALAALLLWAPVPNASAQSSESWAHARQLADDGRYAESLAAIRAALAANADDTGLLWLEAGVTGQAGRHGEALRLYDALIALHPDMADDVAADRAQVLNWSGRHREAARIYRAVLADDATNADAAEGLAFAEYWAGRNDLARQALGGISDHSDAEIEALRRMLDEERRPSVLMNYNSSHDSDDLDVRTWEVAYRHPVAMRDALFLTFRADRVEDALAGYDLKRGGIGHERVWSYTWQTHAYASVVLHGVPIHPVLLDGWVTYRPSDNLRFDLGLAREQVLTRQSLDLGITYWSPALSAEWQMTPRWIARAAHRENFYSDDNRTWLTNGSLRYRVLAMRELKLDLGADGSHLASENDLANGYYDPASYVEFGGGSELTWEPKPRWQLELAGRLGSQKEADGLAEMYYGANGRLEVPLSGRFLLGLEAGTSDSNLSSASGYRRTSWGVSLNTGF